MLDNERDSYIKKILQKDDLISRKADDVFNDFFKEDVEMNREKQKSNNKKIFDFSSITRRKKVLATVASLMVIFLTANGYAAFKGQNNIFFMIRDLVSDNRVDDAEEILSDKDITISYQPIEIANGVTIQVNRVSIKGNEGSLFIKVNKNEGAKTVPYRFVVNEIINDEPMKIGEKSVSHEEDEVEYTEEIKLSGISENCKKMQLQIEDKESKEIAKLDIDLGNKEINIVSSSVDKIEKISESELKDVLGIYTKLNEKNDLNLKNMGDDNIIKIEIAMDLIYSKEENRDKYVKCTTEIVNKAIKEFSGEELKKLPDLSRSYILYDSKEKEYSFDAGDVGLTNALVLNISDISFEDDVYTVTYTYCYPTEEDYTLNNIENLAIFETTKKLTINKEYDYAKYCLKDLSHNSGKIVEQAKTRKTEKVVEQKNDVNKDESVGKDTVNNEKINKPVNENRPVQEKTETNNTPSNVNSFEKIYLESDGLIIGKPYDPAGWVNYRTLAIDYVNWKHAGKYTNSNGYMSIPMFSEPVKKVLLFNNMQEYPVEMIILTESGTVYHIKLSDVFDDNYSYDREYAKQVATGVKDIGKVDSFDGKTVEEMVITYNNDSIKYINKDLGYKSEF